MEKSENLGMQTFDGALYKLYQAGKISQEEAIKNADSANNLRLRIKLGGGDDEQAKAAAPAPKAAAPAAKPAVAAAAVAAPAAGGLKLELETIDEPEEDPKSTPPFQEFLDNPSANQ